MPAFRLRPMQDDRDPPFLRFITCESTADAVAVGDAMARRDGPVEVSCDSRRISIADDDAKSR